jgi:hypothetical protein
MPGPGSGPGASLLYSSFICICPSEGALGGYRDESLNGNGEHAGGSLALINTKTDYDGSYS